MKMPELPPLPHWREDVSKTEYVQSYAKAYAELVREECAKMCDEWASAQIAGGVASMCARDIRGLPDEPGCLHEAADIARAAISSIKAR